jgi:hypothetical protein
MENQNYPVNGTLYFDSNINRANIYFQRNQFILTAIKDINNNWYQNSIGNPSIFIQIQEPDFFNPIPHDWNLELEQRRQQIVVLPPPPQPQPLIRYGGGNNYYNKYLKYKTKYIALKNK